AVQGPRVVLEQRRGDAVELARRVMLDLAVGGYLALASDQLFGALVDGAQGVKSDRAERDQQRYDREKREQQLRLAAARQARDWADKEVIEPHHSLSARLTRSRRNSSGSKRAPRYWTRICPSASISVVSCVWSTEPSSFFKKNTP